MKKSIIISLLFAAFSINAFACGGGMWTYNYYLFSVFNRENFNSDLFKSRLDKCWQEYTNSQVDSWQWNEEKICEIAKQRNDTEMLEYIDELLKYLKISDEIGETWDYPTKEQLQQRKTTLNDMIRQAEAYSGTRLKPQWALLKMRANMLLGNNEGNIEFWNNVAEAMPQSVYRDMMENIYAGALMKTGQRTQACNIFSSQGDLLSMKWAMRKFRSVEGIQLIYNQNPNMPTLNYLVQDFVNNTQETLDSNIDDENEENLSEWFEYIDARIVKYPDVMRFINFANDVIKEGKTSNPALWKAAIGELQYLYGNYDKAYDILNEATTLSGTQRMKDNARAIRLVASVRSKMFKSKKYDKWVVDEMKWLCEKVHQEGNIYNHYAEVMSRFLHNELAPRYMAEGKKELAAALLSLSEKPEDLYGKWVSKDYDAFDDNSWNPNYSTELFTQLDKMSADEILSFMKWTKSKPSGELEKWARKAIVVDDEYYYDIIGTHYMAEGRFSDAIPMLEHVTPQFMQNQNISYLLANRDYTFPRWMGRQRTPKGVSDEGCQLAKLTYNPKLRFCKEIVELETRFFTARKDIRESIAYDLATRYYQASPWGDCWYLTHYSWSSNQELNTGEADFVDKAMAYLETSSQSYDKELKRNSLYALAFIPKDSWCNMEYNWKTDSYLYTPIPYSRQYIAFENLDRFLSDNPQLNTTWITKCDVLKKFRQYK